MKQAKPPVTGASRESRHGSLESYTTGFILSLVLTLAAYFAVVNDTLSTTTLIAGIVILAIAQLFVQLIFFLHIDRERKPRHMLMVSLFTVMVLGIVVYGSIWIMDNLHYNMTPDEVTEYMMEEEGINR
jgi:cytochrome o ubiquinol oxidase operon protein cyoD